MDIQNADATYISRRSLWLDLKIILATILHVVHVPTQGIAQMLWLPEAGVSVDVGAMTAKESIPVSPLVHPYYTN
jgi:hypothetical protein